MIPAQKHLIQQTWSQVLPIADAAAQMFYARLFKIDPSMRPLLRTTDMREQRMRLVQAITVAVKGLDNPRAIGPAVETRWQQARGATSDAQHASVGAALLWTLDKILGSAWTPATANAWSEFDGLLSGIMREATAHVESAAKAA